MPSPDRVAQRTERLLDLTGLPVIPYTVQATYPHDRAAFTQGLFHHEGHLFESTGFWGRSSVRKVRIEDGKLMGLAALPFRCFGEGLVRWDNEIIVLTWQDGIGFRFDATTLSEKSQFHFRGEAWGITCNETELILTNGSSTMYFLEPLTLKCRRSLSVTAQGMPLRYLNDVEWVAGQVWANVWQSDLIARIDAATGEVSAWLDLSALRHLVGARGIDDVLNGIAYSRADDCFFVTGKLWPQMFKITLSI